MRAVVPNTCLVPLLLLLTLSLVTPPTTSTPTIPFTSISTHIPSMLYPVDALKQDILYFTCYWSNKTYGIDFDLYLYYRSVGVGNLVAKGIDHDRDQENMGYFVKQDGRYFVEVRLNNEGIFNYRLQIWRNQIVIQQIYNTGIKTPNIVAQQFTTSVSCLAKLSYTGPPSYSINIYSPKADYQGQPTYFLDYGINQLDIDVNASATGTWSVVVRGVEVEGFLRVGYGIRLDSYVGSQCGNYCTGREGVVGLAPGTTDVCLCRNGYYWDYNSKTCIFDCNRVLYSRGLDTQTGHCKCHPQYPYSPTLQQCILNCSSVSPRLTLQQNSIDACRCPTGYVFDVGLIACRIDCRLVANAVPGVLVGECLCQRGYRWETGRGACGAICGDGVVVGGQECDRGDSNGGDCTSQCKLSNSDPRVNTAVIVGSAAGGTGLIIIIVALVLAYKKGLLAKCKDSGNGKNGTPSNAAPSSQLADSAKQLGFYERKEVN